MDHRMVQRTLTALSVLIIHRRVYTALVLSLLVASNIRKIAHTKYPMLARTTIRPIDPTINTTTDSLHILLVPYYYLQRFRLMLGDSHDQKSLGV